MSIRIMFLISVVHLHMYGMDTAATRAQSNPPSWLGSLFVALCGSYVPSEEDKQTAVPKDRLLFRKLIVERKFEQAELVLRSNGLLFLDPERKAQERLEDIAKMLSICASTKYIQRIFDNYFFETKEIFLPAIKEICAVGNLQTLKLLYEHLSALTYRTAYLEGLRAAAHNGHLDVLQFLITESSLKECWHDDDYGKPAASQIEGAENWLNGVPNASSGPLALERAVESHLVWMFFYLLGQGSPFVSKYCPEINVERTLDKIQTEQRAQRMPGGTPLYPLYGTNISLEEGIPIIKTMKFGLHYYQRAYEVFELIKKMNRANKIVTDEQQQQRSVRIRALLQRLIKNCPALVSRFVTDELGNTLMHKFAELNEITLLKQAHEIDPTLQRQKNKKGNIPLMVAIGNGKCSGVKDALIEFDQWVSMSALDNEKLSHTEDKLNKSATGVLLIPYIREQAKKSLGS